jgi:glucokinase
MGPEQSQTSIACVDIGATKISVSLARAQGWLARVVEPSPVRGEPDALPLQILDMVEQACDKAQLSAQQVHTIGIASCGPFVMQEGALALAAPNLCGGLTQDRAALPNRWTSIPLQAVLRTRFATMQIENDAVAALVAERRWGALKGLAHCAYVTWSTGIGVGLCVDGHVLRGKNGNAGHAGHMYTTAPRADAQCGCGNVGDFEGTCGGLNLGTAAGMPVAQLFAQAQAGDARCVALVDHAIETFAKAMFNLIATLDLQRISIGGSVFLQNAAWLLPRIHAAMPRGLTSLTQGCDIVAAGLGERVGDYAALALAAPQAWDVAAWTAQPLSDRPTRVLT